MTTDADDMAAVAEEAFRSAWDQMVAIPEFAEHLTRWEEHGRAFVEGGVRALLEDMKEGKVSTEELAFRSARALMALYDSEEMAMCLTWALVMIAESRRQ